MNRKTFVGLVAILGIWITAGIALPLVNVLKMFTPEQLLAARGFLTALMAFILLRGRVLPIDRYTLLIIPCVAFASLGLFKGVRTWGASPTIIIVTATPIINFLITIWRGRQVPSAALTNFALVLGGVVLARWEAVWNAEGLFWSLFGTFWNGILYECFAKAKASAFQRCFWGSVGIGSIGLIGGWNANWSQLDADPRLWGALLGFAFVGGFLYWVSNLIAFEKLPKDTASVLAQGETPAVIIAANIMLGEKLTLVQIAGVVLALYGAFRLGNWLAEQDKK